MVKSVKADGKRLSIDFECKGQMGKFFRTNRFYADYNTSVEDVPEEFLVIPFLGAVLPIIWANNAEIHVDEIDGIFLQSMDAYKKSLQKLYPKLSLGGKLVAEHASKRKVNSQTKSMMLFSGGVDSLATYIRHRNEHPTLVCVHGGDISLRDSTAWKNSIIPIAEFARDNESPLRTVHSNCREMLDELMLRVFDDYVAEPSNWWGSVMHGLALLSLCAPLAYVQKTGELYIAATSTSEVTGGWGSHPSLDNSVKWTGTDAIHDGYEVSRQEKLLLISDYAKSGNGQVKLRCCFDSPGGNCGHCEKCSRTIIGLELAGLDPNNYGFKVEATTFSRIKRELLNGRWIIGEDQMFMWEDIKRHAYLKDNVVHPEAKSLVQWLENVDVSSLRTKSEQVRSHGFARKLIPFLEFLPAPLYRIARNYYSFCVEVLPIF